MERGVERRSKVDRTSTPTEICKLQLKRSSKMKNKAESPMLCKIGPLKLLTLHNLTFNLQFDSFGSLWNLGNFFDKTNLQAFGLVLYRNASNSRLG